MDKKSILIGALGASLLFVTIGATYPEQEPKGVWEMHFSPVQSTTSGGECYTLNTETGEVRSEYDFFYNKNIKRGLTYEVAKQRVRK